MIWDVCSVFLGGWTGSMKSTQLCAQAQWGALPELSRAVSISTGVCWYKENSSLELQERTSQCPKIRLKGSLRIYEAGDLIKHGVQTNYVILCNQ